MQTPYFVVFAGVEISDLNEPMSIGTRIVALI